MSKFLGYDGKEYDTVVEWSRANERWEREKSQKESLERQEKLIKQQNELLEEQMEDQRRLVEEQMENDRWIEIERQEHDREMRLLSLCDKIGISQKLMDNFIKYIRSSTDDVLNTEPAKKINNQIDPYIYEIYKIYEQIVEKYNSKMLGDASLVTVHDFSVIYEILKIVSFISLVLIPLCFFYLFIPLGILGITILIYITLGLYSSFQNAKREEFLTLKKKCLSYKSGMTDSEDIYIFLRQFENSYSNLVSDEEKVNQTLCDLKKKRDDGMKELRKMCEQEMNSRLKHFYNFRVSHYNSALEKFLVDYDFENEIKRGIDAFNVNYKVVTKSMATGNGDIDDYVEYFNNVIRK